MSHVNLNFPKLTIDQCGKHKKKHFFTDDDQAMHTSPSHGTMRFSMAQKFQSTTRVYQEPIQKFNVNAAFGTANTIADS